jgi:uncharacterized protein YsxB (DUF464 family)
MIKCRFLYIPEASLICEIKGHAGYNPGNDIVCSAVSALAYTLAGAVNSLCKINEARYNDNPGDFLFDVSIKGLSSPTYDSLKTIFLTVYTGIKLIAESYPKNVEVNFVNNDKLAE